MQAAKAYALAVGSCECLPVQCIAVLLTCLFYFREGHGATRSQARNNHLNGTKNALICHLQATSRTRLASGKSDLAAAADLRKLSASCLPDGRGPPPSPRLPMHIVLAPSPCAAKGTAELLVTTSRPDCVFCSRDSSRAVRTYASAHKVSGHRPVCLYARSSYTWRRQRGQCSTHSPRVRRL